MTKDFLVNLIHFSINPKDDPKQALEMKIKKERRAKNTTDALSLILLTGWRQKEAYLPLKFAWRRSISDMTPSAASSDFITFISFGMISRTPAAKPSYVAVLDRESVAWTASGAWAAIFSAIFRATSNCFPGSVIS